MSNEKIVDLHIHTTASDGTFTPSEIVNLAKDSRVSAIAITDHDTVDGLEEGLSAAKKNDIEIITGVEISAQPKQGTLHILGYGFNHNDPKLNRVLGELVDSRNQRNGKIVKKLQNEGLNITLEEIESVAGGDVIGRPHFAKILLNKGYVKTNQEAFDVYLGKGGKCYLDKERLTPEDSINLIKEAGGTAIIAHPFTLGFGSDEEFKKYLSYMKNIGVDGVEVFYSEHSPERTNFYKKMAEEMNLLVTGGSDFHGDSTPNTVLGKGKGTLRIPYECFQKLMEQ